MKKEIIANLKKVREKFNEVRTAVMNAPTEQLADVVTKLVHDMGLHIVIKNEPFGYNRKLEGKVTNKDGKFEYTFCWIVCSAHLVSDRALIYEDLLMMYYRSLGGVGFNTQTMMEVLRGDMLAESLNYYLGMPRTGEELFTQDEVDSLRVKIR